MRMVLSHQAGLPWTTAPRPEEERFDWGSVSAALAEQAPIWEPGTRFEYHGGTFGYLVGNVVERIDGRALSRFFREEIAEPLGADFLIELGPEHDQRCAEMVGPADQVGPSNTRWWRAAGDGAATGFGSAEGLARVYGALAFGGSLDGVRLLGDETIDAAVEEQPLVHAEGTVLVDSETPVAKLALLDDVLRDLREKSLSYRQLDLRFKDQIVVRRG